MPGCRNKWKKDGGLKFHRIPKDSAQRSQWLASLKLDDSASLDSAWICGSHFISGRPYDFQIYSDSFCQILEVLSPKISMKISTYFAKHEHESIL